MAPPRAAPNRKYTALYDAASACSSTPLTPQWAGGVLRALTSASWTDPTFLEELADSRLILSICQLHSSLKAAQLAASTAPTPGQSEGSLAATPVNNSSSSSSSSGLQDLTDVEEAMRKVRHELGLVDKRVPSGGSLGGPGGSTYCSWDSVGHVCTLMLQALQWAPPAPPPQGQGAADATSPSAAATTPARSTGPNGNAADNAQPAMRNDVDGAGGDPASSSAAAQGTATPANDTTASTPPRGGGAGTGAGAAGAVAATLPGGPSGSGSNTPGRGAGSGTDSPGGARAGAGAVGTSMPAPLATEAGLVRALSHKHVVAHARKVLRGIPEEYRAALGRLLLGKLVREMQATLAGVGAIQEVLRGEVAPGSPSPVPTSLPRAWFATANLVTAYSDILAALQSTAGKGEHEEGEGECAGGVPGDMTAAAATGRVEKDEEEGEDEEEAEPSKGAANGKGSCNSSGAASQATNGQQAQHTHSNGGAGEQAHSAANGDSAQGNGHTHPTSNGDASPGSPAATDTPGRRPSGTATPSTPTAASPAAIASASASNSSPTPDVTAPLTSPLEEVRQLACEFATCLCDAVRGAHAAAHMAVLLRGEATAKYPSVAAYMPAALTINELMAQVDALVCVALSLGPSVVAAVRQSVGELLGSPAVRDLLGAGKVYVATVIAAGALTRDLGLEAAVPASLRQGYLSAVLMPLDSGALLNERRAPQVLAYRNSITDSSYYQVMEVDALPYGVNVRFEDEQEAEGAGVLREWLSQIAADLFSPERGLFVRGAEDGRMVHPAPHPGLLPPAAASGTGARRKAAGAGKRGQEVEEHLGYMRFAGRIVGLALRANVPLGVVLSSGLWAHMTGRKATLADLRQLDPQMYHTCQNILTTPGADALDLYHVWHHSDQRPTATSSSSSTTATPSSSATSATTPANSASASVSDSPPTPGPGPSSSPGVPALPAINTGAASTAGQSENSTAVELVPGGASLRVTDDNKAAYVELLAHHLVIGAVEEQASAFLSGVQDTAHHLPDDPRLRRAFLTPLLPEDLNKVTAGESSLDPADWAAHTDTHGFDSQEEKSSVSLFWQLVSEYGQEDRQRLLQFWTAMTHLPSGGFKALHQRLQVMKLGGPAAAATPAAAAAATPAAAAAATPAAATNAAAATTAAANGTAGGAAAGATGAPAGGASAGAGTGAAAAGPVGRLSGAGAEQLHSHALADGVNEDLLDEEDQQEGAGAGAGAGAAAQPGAVGSAGADAAPAAESGLRGGEDGDEEVEEEEGIEDEDEVEEVEEEDEEEEGEYDEEGMYEDEAEGHDGGMLDEDEEEFQRQLQLALELSLQGMDEPSGGGSGQQQQQQEQLQQQQAAPGGEGEAEGAGGSGSGSGSAEQGGAPERAEGATGAGEGAGGDAGSSSAAAEGEGQGASEGEGGAAAGSSPEAAPEEAAAPAAPQESEGPAAAHAATAPATPQPLPQQQQQEEQQGRTAAPALPGTPDRNTPRTSSPAATPSTAPSASATGSGTEAGTPATPTAAADADPAPAAEAGAHQSGEGPATPTTPAPPQQQTEQQQQQQQEEEQEDQEEAPAEGAAATPSTGRAGSSAPLLPQARTCFLQLNLPVYGSLAEMRRAFDIALENMAFGMH